MKQLFPICAFLLVIFAGTAKQGAFAQTTVTQTMFTAKVNTLDSLIGISDLTDAGTTFDIIHTMMKDVLHTAKISIHTAADSVTRASTMTLLTSQQIPTYQQIIKLKQDMVTNRSALHTQLMQFNNTIH